MNVAVIPARGGSKRIPRKNVRPFAGLPMIAHSIRCAQETGLFADVIVSTDDDEIAEVAERFGATVPFRRPAELSDDTTGTTAVVAHTVEWLRQQGRAPAAVCCIYATAPLVTPADIASGLSLLQEARWRYAFSATTYVFPVFRAFRELDAGGVEMLFPEHRTSRSQDLPETLHDAGQFYWGRPEAWMAQEAIFAPHSTFVRIPPWRVQDIDTPDDWHRAEVLHRVLTAEQGIPAR